VHSCEFQLFNRLFFFVQLCNSYEMGRTVDRIMLLCKGLCSICRGRIRKFHEVSESSLDSSAPARVPSFDLELDFGDQISTSQDVGLVILTPKVVKRARTGKRVPASPIGVVVGGKRCDSFSEICTSLAPSLVDVPTNRCDTGCLNLDSFRFKELVPISVVEYSCE
jgi:hypothetical protein